MLEWRERETEREEEKEENMMESLQSKQIVSNEKIFPLLKNKVFKTETNETLCFKSQLIRSFVHWYYICMKNYNFEEMF